MGGGPTTVYGHLACADGRIQCEDDYIRDEREREASFAAPMDADILRPKWKIGSKLKDIRLQIDMMECGAEEVQLTIRQFKNGIIHKTLGMQEGKEQISNIYHTIYHLQKNAIKIYMDKKSFNATIRKRANMLTGGEHFGFIQAQLASLRTFYAPAVECSGDQQFLDSLPNAKELPNFTQSTGPMSLF